MIACSRIALFVVVLASTTGCMMSASKVQVSPLAKVDKGPKVVTFLHATEYIAEMSVALAEFGFAVKPMPSQQEILELQGAGRLAKYNEASTRWGITLTAKDAGMTCVLTDSDIYYFTMMLTDITNNQIVLVLKQKGSDGPCTTIKPVFEALAEELAKNW